MGPTQKGKQFQDSQSHETENVVMSLIGPGSKNECAGKGL
jgi:hypothetical protein